MLGRVLARARGSGVRGEPGRVPGFLAGPRIPRPRMHWTHRWPRVTPRAARSWPSIRVVNAGPGSCLGWGPRRAWQAGPGLRIPGQTPGFRAEDALDASMAADSARAAARHADRRQRGDQVSARQSLLG